MVETSGGTDGTAASLPAEDAPRLLELAQAFLGVEHALAFYPAGHQARQAPVGRFLAALRALAAPRGSATIGFAEEELLWEGQMRAPLAPALRKMVEAFARPGIAHVTWTAEVGAEEAEALVARIAERRGGGHGAAWGEPWQHPHLHVEGIDYQALMAEDPGAAEAERRRGLWRALLRRLAEDPAAELTPEELQLLAGEWEDPATLAACILEGIGPAAAEGEPAAVAALRRLAEAVEAGPGEVAAGHGDLLRRAGRELPPALRLRLVEAAIDAGRQDLFARAFGSPGADELATLLAGNFLLEPERIGRLTRVFQHLVPRRLERMELADEVRTEVLRASAPEEALAANAWEEAQELLTGEAGDFMSPGYRELLQRLAVRGARRRDAEAALAQLPGIEEDLEARRTGEESVAILAEQLALATGEDGFREAVAGLAAAAAAALAAGERRRGVRALAALCRAADGEGPLAGPREALAEALRGAATPESLAAILTGAEGPDRAGDEVLAALAAVEPEAVAGALFEALATEGEGGRRRQLLGLLPRLGPRARAAALDRMAEAPLPVARALFDVLASAPDPAAVPGVVALLARDDRRLRRDAVRLLARIDTPEARRALAGLLRDEDEDVVRLAAVHLGATGDRESVQELLATVGGRKGPGVLQAVTALGWMRADAAVGPLAELLGRRSWIGRRAQEELGAAAALALARIGGAEARQALQTAGASLPAPVAGEVRRLLARREGP